MPKLTVITRKAYGGAYDVMSSKHMRGDINFAWPTAEIAVMGVGRRGQHPLQGRDRPGRRPGGRAAASWSPTTRRSSPTPYVAAARGYVDEVIEPRDTRAKLIRALEMLQEQARHEPAEEARQHPAVRTASPPAPMPRSLARTPPDDGEGEPEPGGVARCVTCIPATCYVGAAGWPPAPAPLSRPCSRP